MNEPLRNSDTGDRDLRTEPSIDGKTGAQSEFAQPKTGTVRHETTAESANLTSQDGSGLDTMPTFDSPQLAAAMDRYDEAVRKALEDAKNQTMVSILSPLRDLLTQLRAAAEELLSHFNSADISTPEACYEKVRQYRENGRKQILTPLTNFLTERAPAREASSVLVNLLSEIALAADELPVSAEVLDQAEAFESDPADALWMQVKKWNYRRRIRSGDNQLLRPVSARALASYNSLSRIPPFLNPSNEILQQEIARVLAVVEKAIADWASQTLVLERPLAPYVRDRVDPELLLEIRTSESRRDQRRANLKLTANNDKSAAKAPTTTNGPVPSQASTDSPSGTNSANKAESTAGAHEAGDGKETGSDNPSSSDKPDGSIHSKRDSGKGDFEGPGTSEVRQSNDHFENTTTSAADESDPTNGEPVDADDATADLAKVVESLRRLAEDLDVALKKAIGLVPVVHTVEPKQINGARRALRQDVKQAGTPFLSIDDRQLASTADVSAPARATERRWLKWNHEIVDRLDLYGTLFDLRAKMLGAEAAILNDVARLSIRPVCETFAGIKSVLRNSAEEASAAAEEASRTNDLVALREAIKALDASNDEFFSRTLRDLPGMVSADEILANSGARSWVAVTNLVEESPEELRIHDLRLDPENTINPEEESRSIQLRARLLDGIQPLDKKLKAGGEPLRRVLQRIWIEVEKTKTIVDYNLDTASAELARIISGELQIEEEVVQADEYAGDLDRGVERTTELVIKGYERAATSFDELLPNLTDPWNGFSETVLNEVQQQWAVVLRKARPGDTGAPDWEGFVATVRRSWQLFTSIASDYAAKTGQRAKTWFVVARRRAKKLIRIGQTAVGALEASDEDLTWSLDELGRVGEIRRELPLVYRHLFAFEPLAEARLFEGRASDLSWLRNRIERWTDGEPAGSTFISSPVGSGRTSFLSIASDTLLEGVPHKLVNPPKRMSEAELATFFADATDVLIDGDEPTLAALEAAIVQKGPSETGFVCLIDNFEHLFLKSTNGTALVERFLLMMSRTDTCIFWVAAIGDLPWRYLTSTAGTAAAYPIHHSLKSITRESLESIIAARHNRSAMPIRFEVSAAQSDAMKRWLSRNRTDEEKQQYARSQYFDRLFRYSGQSLMLALFYWIRSANFSADSDMVEMKAIEPLKFETLSRLTLQRSFSLEAFLFHKTLSLKEHNEVLRLSETDGTMLIEALLNARLLVRVRKPNEEREGAVSDQIRPEDRFRIRPLLIHPIRTMLSAQHVVY